MKRSGGGDVHRSSPQPSFSSWEYFAIMVGGRWFMKEIELPIELIFELILYNMQPFSVPKITVLENH